MDSLVNSMSKLSIKKPEPTILHIKIHDSDETIQVTIPRKRFYKRIVPRFDIPPVDEVEQGVKDWYAALGQPVPEADLIFMREMKAAEEEAEKAAETAQAITKPEVPEEMPPHGTPEFWAWCRRRTAAKNAERAAAGLPPLPTAAQKRKEAEKKAAEKAAKLAAKAAKK